MVMNTREEMVAEIEARLADCKSRDRAREERARDWLISFVRQVTDRKASELRILFIGLIEIVKAGAGQACGRGA